MHSRRTQRDVPFTQSTGQLTIPALCPSFYNVRQVVDNTTTHVFTKADFITYYESTETGRPVSSQPTVRPLHRPLTLPLPCSLLNPGALVLPCRHRAAGAVRGHEMGGGRAGSGGRVAGPRGLLCPGPSRGGPRAQEGGGGYGGGRLWCGPSQASGCGDDEA